MSMTGSKNILKLVVISLMVLGVVTPTYAKDSYRSFVKKWTEHKQWYSAKTMQAEMLWHATYYSSEFRRALEQEYIKRKYLNPIEAAQYVAEQEKKQAEGDEFFIGLYTVKPYRAFSMGKESFWQIRLFSESGEEIEPLRIDIVEITPLEKILFPYLKRWEQAYRVVFPKLPLGNSFELVLRSVIGETRLKWDLAHLHSHPLELFQESTTSDTGE